MLENWFSYDNSLDGRLNMTKVDISWADMKLQWSQRPFLLYLCFTPKRSRDNEPLGGFQRRRVDGHCKKVTEKAEEFGFIVVAERRCGNKTELFSYGPNDQQAEEIIQSSEKGFLQMQSVIRYEEDWETFRESLCPSKSQIQSFDNERMIERLKSCGDQLITARRINHHISFPNELIRMDFEQAALQAGFAIGEPYYAPERPMAYGACVHNRSTLDLEYLNKATSKLIKIAESMGGLYEYWDCAIQRRRR